LLDDIAIWDRPLSDGEIAYLASNPVLTPEPGTFSMLGTVLGGLVWLKRRSSLSK